MSRRRKKCRCCRELYHPHPQTYRQQITCDKPACRAWRRRQAQSEWRSKNPLYDDHRRPKLETWRRTHRSYWRKWRAAHPAAVTRNRRLQKRRDALKRANLAKQNEWIRVWREETMQKARLRDLAKQNEWKRFVDGIFRKMNLAKRNAMAPAA